MSESDPLGGVRCPKCGNGKRLIVEAKVALEVTATGTKIANDEFPLEDNAHAVCPECEFEAPFAAFTGGRSPALLEVSAETQTAVDFFKFCSLTCLGLFESRESDNGRRFERRWCKPSPSSSYCTECRGQTQTL